MWRGDSARSQVAAGSDDRKALLSARLGLGMQAESREPQPLTGMPAERAHGSIRISMGRDTEKKDVEYLIDVLPKVIEKIRGMSTAYTEEK